MKNNLTPINHEEIISKIYYIREQKVMLDSDLAVLYEVETKRLNEQVKRNIKRFPNDFMFQLNKEEFEILRSQIATSRFMHGGRKYLPFCFTENGVAMLSSVLTSEKAVEVNIQIIRVFTSLRKLALTNAKILTKLESIEKSILKHGIKLKQNDQQFQVIFEAIKHIMMPPEKPKKIGFL